MAKLISCAVLVLLGMTGWARPALAQVPGGGSEVLCQLVDGPFVDRQDGGAFPLSPVGCDISPYTEASISVQPFTGLLAQADAEGLEPIAGGSASNALAELQYDFTVTGGQVGDLVPVLVLTHMETQASSSTDANNANIASALIDVRALSPVSGARNEDGAGACDVSPGRSCGQPATVDAELSLTIASGTSGRVFLQVIAAASSLFEGLAFATIDPFIFVDPHFANAANYTITVDSRVGNALPVAAVPEPGVWALLLAGLGGLGAAERRRRTRAASRAGAEQGNRPRTVKRRCEAHRRRWPAARV